MRFELRKVLSDLGVDPKFHERVSVGWEESMSNMPASEPDFMRDGSLREAREYCGLEPSADEALDTVVREMRRNPSLMAFAWHCRWHVVESQTIPGFQDWPRLGKPLGPLAGMVYLVAALGIVPKARAKYAAMGIPEDVVRDTLRQVCCFYNNHKAGFNGAPGLISNQLGWLRLYISGSLFRLGRMEYRLMPMPSSFGAVYRNKKTGAKVAFADPTAKYDDRGFVCYEGDTDFWQAGLLVGDGFVEGFPVSPCGHALKSKVRLGLDEWECALAPGDVFLDMHIPSGGNMSLETCADSFQRAFKFFREHFRDGHKEVISCRSWIFNTQLEESMPDSNLARLMRELYLFPSFSMGRDGFFFVFCREYENLADAPRDTSLQRFMVDTLASGGKLRSGGMFLFDEDMQFWGSRRYRKTWGESGF